MFYVDEIGFSKNHIKYARNSPKVISGLLKFSESNFIYYCLAIFSAFSAS